MYGIVHIILKDLALSLGGDVAWQKILKEAGLSQHGLEELLEPTLQKDEVSLCLMHATCEVFGLTSEAVLRAFGNHFVVFALRTGSAAFLSQGATFPAFLDNLAQIHTYWERDLPGVRFPCLQATSDAESEGALLTYLSSRQGFASMVLGMVEEIGRRLYGVDVAFEAVEVPEELQAPFRAGRAAAWHLTWTERPGGPLLLEPQNRREAGHRLAFPQLHGGLVDFMRLLAGKELPTACKQDEDASASRHIVGATSALKPGISRETTGVDSDHEYDAMTMSCSYKKLPEGSTTKKLSEVLLGGRPLHRILLRATSAESVSGCWLDGTLAACRAFWESSVGRAEDYDLSEDADSVDLFVSHAWSAPADWEKAMGTEVSYADMKSANLAVMAKDIAVAKQEPNNWRKVTFWVDKACIPQDEPSLKESCIHLLDKFIQRSDRVCVLFTWTYLQRLWCVYEWACILEDKEPRQVLLANEHFVTDQTLPLYIDAVRFFSLRDTQCSIESDRATLETKIHDTYISRAAFEGLVKVAATAFMARSMAFRAGCSAKVHERFFMPWVALARELQFDELAEALGTCRAIDWRGEATPTRPMSPKEVNPSKYHERINAWFDKQVAPVLQKMRLEAVLYN